MKKFLTLILMVIISSLGSGLFAQDAPKQTVIVQKAVYFDVSPPIRDMRGILTTTKKEGDDDEEIPNKFGFRDSLKQKSAAMAPAEDPVWQKQNGSYLPANVTPLTNFDGIPNLSGVYPPDTQGDVSLADYVQVVNCKFTVYSKAGVVRLGPLDLQTIWAGIPAPWNGTNNGDPVVLYDQAANRWLITQFSLPAGSTTQYAELVAVSTTSDPTGSWYRYVFQYGSKMPDYPKLGVWPDGYYMATNQFINGATWGGVGATVLERTKMIAGDPTASMQYFNLGASADPESMLPSDWDGPNTPVAGEANHFTYFNDWASVTDRYLRIWDFHVDWVNPVNSTFAQVANLVTASFDAKFCGFDGGQCIPQPGTTVKLETLSDRLMYRLQYRNFGSYRAMVTNHSVDVNGADHAGVRWYELRNTGAGWNIYQQGTYAPDAIHRWMGSIAMNSIGDISLGYSVSDATSTYPGIRYTGRKAGDALGTMTIAETTIINGAGFQSGSIGRWGDYSMMSVDPSDDITFWYTTEYVQTSTGTAPWRTRIASYKFTNPPSVVTLPAFALGSTSATLYGSVNPNSLSTNYHFEYGATTAYGSSTPTISAGSGALAVNFSAAITGLLEGHTYHYRLVAVNSDGTSNGTDLFFSTPCTGVFGLPFSESFVNTSIPNCWSQVDHQGNGQVWQFGTITAYGSSNPVLTGNYAYLNSDGYLNGNSQNADLVSPTLDLTAYAAVTLSFNYFYRAISVPPSSGTLSYSIDNGGTWVGIQSFTANSTNPAIFSLVIPGVAGHPQVKFKWNYTGSWGWYWAIDDVQITGVPVNMQISNVDIPNGTTKCYSAAQTITVAGSGTTFDVRTGGSATMIAGVNIDILPGATLHQGGYFWGYIAPSGPFCVSPAMPAVNQGDNLTQNVPDLPATITGNQVKIYPNPTPGKFTLELSGSEFPDKVRVEIYGIRGEKILSKEVAGQKTQEFSLSEAPTGIYFVRVYAGDKAETIKLVKY